MASFLGKKSKDDERRGAGAAWTPGSEAAKINIGPLAGPQGGLPGALGAAAPGGAAQPTFWQSFVSAIARATGLAPAAAGNAGVAALILGATTAVVAVSHFVGNPTPESRPVVGARVFSDSDPAAVTASAPAAKTPPVQGTSGLEYLQGAKDGSLDQVPDAAPAEPAEQTAAANAPAAAESVEVVAAKTSGAKTKPAPNRPGFKQAQRPQMGASTMQSAVQLQKLQGLSEGSGFQEIYKPNANGQAGSYSADKRANAGRSTRSALLASGSNAAAQAKFAHSTSRQGARVGNTNSAAAYASQAFDGSNSLGQAAGELPKAGTALGGAGVTGSASTIQDVRAIDLPPAPEAVKNQKNQTPYQGLIYAGMAALMLGMVLLKMAGSLISQGQKAGPAGLPQIAQGKSLAMAAMGAGGAAAAIGAMVSGQYDQIQQGLPFMIGGGALAAQAGMVLAKADQAGEQAQGESDNAFMDAGQQAMQQLGQMAGQQGNQVDADLDQNAEKQRQRVDITRNSGGPDAARGGTA